MVRLPAELVMIQMCFNNIYQIEKDFLYVFQKEHLSPSLLRRVIPSQKEPQLLSLGRWELKKFLPVEDARAVPSSGYSAKKREFGMMHGIIHSNWNGGKMRFNKRRRDFILERC
ncbi:hypothetical protein CEXT_605051 [Caerostris extrusa]|uniref:Uncharacterized protein n=1 Tax=Caerostris extrusa TaxID=172846 RepID=A0AAV4Y9I7_CAEEX|nr:hypothetical protein CEXT_605051 [Caerostris extrusa]